MPKGGLNVQGYYEETRLREKRRKTLKKAVIALRIRGKSDCESRREKRKVK